MFNRIIEIIGLGIAGAAVKMVVPLLRQALTSYQAKCASDVARNKAVKRNEHMVTFAEFAKQALTVAYNLTDGGDKLVGIAADEMLKRADENSMSDYINRDQAKAYIAQLQHENNGGVAK